MKSLVLLAMLGISLQTHAQNRLSEASYLRKLSFHIQGTKPSSNDFRGLESTPPEQREQFFNTKINEYLKSPGHQDRMRYRLSELFRLKTPSFDKSFLPEQEINQFSEDSSAEDDSLTNLFERLAEDNLSWDELLVGKSYRLFHYDNFSDRLTSDFGFFKLVYAGLPDIHMGVINSPFAKLDPKEIKPINITFDKDDPRIAGALTTRRFFSRYTTTVVNKNRRRAAAVFRIFLCDSMIPAIPSKSDRKHEFLDSTFADQFEVTDDMLPGNGGSSAPDRHGVDPQCMACHSKLDPLGRSFQGSGVVLHPDPFAGRLYFKRKGRENINISGRGIGDLTLAITKQKEYSECQVKWFWDQFIGKDVPLMGTTESELILNFDKVGRRTNDFIKYIVTRPEFRSKPKAVTYVSFGKVKPLLKRCDSCHADEETIPDFSSLPIGWGDKNDELKYLNEMNRRLHLPFGDKEQMPEDRAKNWSENDIKLIEKWISDGARNENGTPEIDPNKLESK